MSYSVCNTKRSSTTDLQSLECTQPVRQSKRIMLKKEKVEQAKSAVSLPPCPDKWDSVFWNQFKIKVPVTFTAQMQVDSGCKEKIESCWKRLSSSVIADHSQSEHRGYIRCIEESHPKGSDRWTEKYKIKWIGPEVGYGLFARRPYSQNSIIGFYTGYLTSDVVDQEYAFEWVGTPYEEDRLAIDGLKMGNATRFMNHAPTYIDGHKNHKCNVSAVEVFYNGLPHILFIAERSIASKEQLCYDYGDGYWEKKGVKPSLL